MIAAALAAVVLSCVGCYRAADRTTVPQAEVQSREVHDDLGRAIKVPAKIDRAISLAPSLTEMIFAIGAGDKLVGVTTYCNYPPETASIEKIGDTQTPNIEKIIALKPQVVFVSTASQLEAFTKTLEEQGIAVYVSNPKNLDEVFKDMGQLADLFGTKATASGLGANLSTRVANVDIETQVFLEKHPRQKVFIQISNDPLFTIGKDSFLTELVERAGGVSVTKDVPTGYPKLSKETAAALNPDVIFLSDSEDNREPNKALKDSAAVKGGRLYRIDADIISRPGPRLVDALEEIASKLREQTK
jgi:iron complex transport system substrate-binding protein